MQSIYNSNLNRFSRNIVMTNLHDYLISQIKPFKSAFLKKGIAYPIKIKIVVHTVINHGSISMRNGKLCWKFPKKTYIPNWDIENLASIWVKAFNDSLVILKMIPDDNINYVNNVEYKFEKVEDLKDRKLEIIIT